MAKRLMHEVDQADLAVSSTARLDIPNVHWHAATELHIDAVVSTSSGAITIANATLGVIPLIESIRYNLDGSSTVFDLSGTLLDTWSRVDRPGSERLALSSTTSADPWDAVLRYEHAQSEANPVGSIPLWFYNSPQIEVRTGAISTIGSGTGIAVSGSIRLLAERYDQRSRFAQPSSVVGGVMHRLTSFIQDFTGTGERRVDLKGYHGELLERLMVIANNNSADTWALFESLDLKLSDAESLQKMRTEQFRARQMRNYGGDDVPITGAYVFDLRRAGDQDVIHLGDPIAAPDPHVVTNIASGTSLTSAKATFVVETLARVNRDQARLAQALAA